MTDQRLIGFAKRVREQAERFRILHDIDLAASPDQLREQLDRVIVELASITRIAPGSGDFIGLVEHYSSGRFSYFRG